MCRLLFSDFVHTFCSYFLFILCSPFSVLSHLSPLSPSSVKAVAPQKSLEVFGSKMLHIFKILQEEGDHPRNGFEDMASQSESEGW